MKVPKTNAEHTQTPDSCPFCQSEDIEARRINIEGSQAWQDVKCNTCAKKWSDVYTLTGYEEN